MREVLPLQVGKGNCLPTALSAVTQTISVWGREGGCVTRVDSGPL